jgi:hypothetical protein
MDVMKKIITTNVHKMHQKKLQKPQKIHYRFSREKIQLRVKIKSLLDRIKLLKVNLNLKNLFGKLESNLLIELFQLRNVA